MSVLSHYRDRLRGWGSQDLTFSTPPPLTYSPKGHWGGLHHYMAHASTVEPNPEVYEMAMERAESGLGVGLHEARHWHRHAYGGLMDLSRLSPAELGHAAAYEAFRYLLHHEPLYEPLADEAEREREVLLSLAIAEATRLYREAQRFGDEYGLQTACSSAAATASLLYSQQRDVAEIGPGHLSQRSAGRPYGQAYTEDDAALYRRAGIPEPDRGRIYGRSTYGGSAYGGRSGRALSEEPPYARSYAGSAGMAGAGMGELSNSSLARGMGMAPYPGGSSAGMNPAGPGASSYGGGMGGPPYGADESGPLSPLRTGDPRLVASAGRSPYPASPTNSSYPNGAGGFVPNAGVPDVQRSGSPVHPGNQQGYPGLNAPSQASYGGVGQPLYGGVSGAMPQAAYNSTGAPGTTPQVYYNGMPGVMPQAGYGGAPPVSGGMPGGMPQVQSVYGGVPQLISGGLPGAMSQAPYPVAPPTVAGQSAYPGAQVYPPGSTIVLASRKRRHRRRARSRDLDERDRYYRERRATGDGYDSY